MSEKVSQKDMILLLKTKLRKLQNEYNCLSEKLENAYRLCDEAVHISQRVTNPFGWVVLLRKKGYEDKNFNFRGFIACSIDPMAASNFVRFNFTVINFISHSIIFDSEQRAKEFAQKFTEKVMTPKLGWYPSKSLQECDVCVEYIKLSEYQPCCYTEVVDSDNEIRDAMRNCSYTYLDFLDPNMATKNEV